VVPTLLEEQRCEQAALDAALYHQYEHVFCELHIRYVHMYVVTNSVTFSRFANYLGHLLTEIINSGGIHLFTRDYRGRKTMCQAHLTVNYKTEEQVHRCRHYPAHVFLTVVSGAEDRYVVEWVDWFREKRDRY